MSSKARILRGLRCSMPSQITVAPLQDAFPSTRPAFFLEQRWRRPTLHRYRRLPTMPKPALASSSHAEQRSRASVTRSESFVSWCEVSP